jgi:hypothetical protein
MTIWETRSEKGPLLTTNATYNGDAKCHNARLGKPRSIIKTGKPKRKN